MRAAKPHISLRIVNNMIFSNMNFNRIFLYIYNLYVVIGICIFLVVDAIYCFCFVSLC